MYKSIEIRQSHTTRIKETQITKTTTTSIYKKITKSTKGGSIPSGSPALNIQFSYSYSVTYFKLPGRLSK